MPRQCETCRDLEEHVVGFFSYYNFIEIAQARSSAIAGCTICRMVLFCLSAFDLKVDGSAAHRYILLRKLAGGQVLLGSADQECHPGSVQLQNFDARGEWYPDLHS